MTILITLLLLLIVADYSQCKQEETTESQFKKWFTSNGGVIKAIEIYDFEHMGRGFMATQDIVSETEILKIPANLIFSTQSMKSSNDAGLLTLLRRFDPEVALKAWLLLEAVEGETSFFYEYISILPKTIPSLLGFPEELCAELQDTEFIGEVKTFQERVKSEYASFSTKFRQLYPALNVSFADYSWATAVLDSRGLRFRGEVYLAPMADMFNYAPHSDARAANSGNFFLQHHILESDGGIRILADRDTANGMQLFEDYGDNTDDIYLKYHGFVAEGNPFRCIRLDSSVLSSSAYTYVNGKSDLLRELEFKKAPRKCMDQTGALSKGLEVYLTVLAFNDGEASQCRALTKKHPQKWPKIFRDCKFESISNFVANILSEGINTSKLSSLETRFLNVLQELIRVTSMRYNTTIAFDEAAIYDVDQKLKGCLFSADSAMTDECYTHTQRKLALRYRLFSKKMLNQICKLYGVDCINLISSPTQLKASGDSNNFDVGPTMLLEKMTTFNAWFSSFNPSPSKIAAQWIPNYRIGTVSTDEIALDEKYLGVPQQIIMDSDKAIMKNSSVFSLIEGLFSRYKSRDDFHELMFFLIQEYFVIKEKSFYWPYLSLLPTKNDLDIPLFWSPEEVDQRLAPSQLKSVIINYQEKTRLMYEAILKIDLIASFFTKDTLSYDNYLWATAILDSRSIWWNGKRHLVPMLDFVNCKEDSVNPTRIHSTNLSPDGDYAITRAGM